MQPVKFILVLVLALLGSLAGCCPTNVTVVMTSTKVVTNSVDSAVFNHVNSTIINTSHTRSGFPKSGKSLTSSSIGLNSTQTTTDFVTVIITSVPTITCTVGHECPITSTAAVVAPTSPNPSNTAANASFASGTTTLKVTATRTSTITYTLEKVTSASPGAITSTSTLDGTAEFTAGFVSYTTQMSATSTVMTSPPFPKLNATTSATDGLTYLAAAKQTVDNSSSVSLVNGSVTPSVLSPSPRPESPPTDSSTTTITVIPSVTSDSLTPDSTSTVVITPTVTQTTINTSTGTSTITQLVVGTASSGVQGKLQPARPFVFLAALAKAISKAAAELIDTTTQTSHDACPCTTFSVNACVGCSGSPYNAASSGDCMESRPTKALFAMANKHVKARAVADEVTQTTVTVTRYVIPANSTLTSTVYNATTTIYCSTCSGVNSTSSVSLSTTDSVLTAEPYPYGINAPPMNSTPITSTTHPPASGATATATDATSKVASCAALVSVGCLIILAMAVIVI